jgi:hypothetical protein
MGVKMKNNYESQNFFCQFVEYENHIDNSVPWQDNAFTLISLRVIMLKAHAEKWAGILGSLIRFFNKISKLEDDDQIEEPLHKELDTWLKTAFDESELLELHYGVMKAIERTQSKLNQGSAAAISKALEKAIQVIFDNLHGIMFLHIMPGSVHYYNEKQLFGPEVAGKFPQIVSDDIEEAGKCFALNRYTACVFHLMRVMESGVQKLGDKLSVSLANEKCWDTILKDSRTKINAQYPKSHPENVRWKNLLAKLETVKDAWRNPTMHPKATYTKQHAEEVWFAVKIFMRELARIL